MSSQQTILFRELLDSCKQLHQELTAVFVTLDTKAQNCLTVDGIILASCFAFGSKVYADPSVQLSPFTRILFLLTCVLAVLSMIWSVRSMRIREISTAPQPEEVDRLVADLLKGESSEIEQERVARFHADLARIWNTAIKSLRGANDEKSVLLGRAQFLLLLALVFLASMLVLGITLGIMG